MTNPNQVVRMLLVYAICIPLAIAVGYLITNPLDYTTLGFLGVVIVLILSPIFIKWHYPIMVFGLSLPAQMFFLVGNPPAWQVVVMLSLGIAIVERATSSEHRFLKAPAMTWALLYTALMAFITMKLTGGFHLHAVGGAEGGGKKYINLFLGIATFFALASRGIPPDKRNLYIALFFLPGALTMCGDLFARLPAPLNYFNLLIPSFGYSESTSFITNFNFFARWSGLSNSATAIMLFMLARYGLRGMLPGTHSLRFFVFVGMFALSLMGGFRSALAANVMLVVFMFFLEGLHRTKWMALGILLTILAGGGIAAFSRQLPDSIQRSISFLPVDVNPVVLSDAEGSSDWRFRIWEALLPKIPGYLLLGKGYSLSVVDYESMGRDTAFARTGQVFASEEALAISNDFHSGPLSTIICFGIWGVISILAIMIASVYILYHNFRYGDSALKAVNTMLLAYGVAHVLFFFFIFGAYDNDVGWFAKIVGFSVALNWGVNRARAQAQTQAAATQANRRLET